MTSTRTLYGVTLGWVSGCGSGLIRSQFPLLTVFNRGRKAEARGRGQTETCLMAGGVRAVDGADVLCHDAGSSGVVREGDGRGVPGQGTPLPQGQYR